MERMGPPVRKSLVQVPEIFAHHAMLMPRIAIAPQLVQLVEKMAPVERMQLRQKIRQRPNGLQALMQSPHRYEAGELLLGGATHGVG